MGLVKTVELSSGMTIENAYIRIETFSGSKISINVSMKAYLSKELADSGKDCLFEQQEIFTPSVLEGAPNFIAQGYEYLKTLPEFEDAVDA